MVWLITRVLLLFFIIGSCKCDQYVSAPQYVVPLLDLLSPEAIIAANGDFPIAAILINTGKCLTGVTKNLSHTRKPFNDGSV